MIHCSPCKVQQRCQSYADTADGVVQDGTTKVQNVFLRVIKSAQKGIVESIHSVWAKATDYKTYVRLSESERSSDGADSADGSRHSNGLGGLKRVTRVMFQLQEQYPTAMKFVMLFFILYMLVVAIVLASFFNGRKEW
jgi:hypothetical protein